MSKVSHPPGFRPPNPTRTPQRPTNQRRASRNQGVQGGPQRIDEVEDEIELEKMQEEAASLGHNGGKSGDQRETAWAQLEQFRNKSNAGVGGDQQRGRAEHSAREEANSTRMTAELQTAAQSNPTRSIFGSKPRGIDQAQAAQAAQALAPQQAVSSAQPSVASQKPSVSSPPRPGAPLNAHGLLATGKAVGTFVKELALSSLAGTELHGKLQSAVSTAQQLLANKEGIARVGLGENKNAEHIVLVVAKRGASLKQLLETVPEKIQGIGTLISIGFDVLPLKRGGSPSSTSIPRTFTG
ncbi:hypothetical protein MYSTI_02543 [Myxococcus stipitatus DSM 14675]|uniref:Uncharacterized protein n=1 Tax=Myxococcus stipitatus (strain DSM 14675 / JCM 12634 / Mx s8) TaxID=1278073 RepID=L7UBK7_MYXSD|nr:hypothetical protein [Myxococcus stipitatus]AGC43859.1 hypothetical protein MYSTI_02543 [Myxococcus stipitatus DSM 14675]